MSEELQKALAQMILKLTEGFETGAAFVGEQMPEVLEQLLRYKFVTSLGLALVLTAFVVVYVWKVLPRFWAAGVKDDCQPVVVFVTALIFAVYGGALTACTFLQIWLAPKVYLIEYAASLAK